MTYKRPDLELCPIDGTFTVILSFSFTLRKHMEMQVRDRDVVIWITLNLIYFFKMFYKFQHLN